MNLLRVFRKGYQDYINGLLDAMTDKKQEEDPQYIQNME